MAVEVRQVGRNEPCPCGSGKKYKQCHASKAAQMSPGQLWTLIVVSVVFLGGLVLAVASRQEHVAQPAGVWSEEHGHYH